jgi:hypothetical protein
MNDVAVNKFLGIVEDLLVVPHAIEELPCQARLGTVAEAEVFMGNELRKIESRIDAHFAALPCKKTDVA